MEAPAATPSTSIDYAGARDVPPLAGRARERDVPAAVAAIDAAIAALGEALTFADDRVSRLAERVSPVLGLDEGRVEPADPQAPEGPRAPRAALADDLEGRAGAIRSLADGVRQVGRRADALGDRVEL